MHYAKLQKTAKTMPEIGDTAPDFTLPSTQGEINLRSLNQGKKLVLAFYTEDNTPRCSQMLSAFKDEYATIQELGAEVIAINTDTLESHEDFLKSAGGFPFPLASDPDLTVAKLYGVVGEDGKRANRAIYVLNEGGTILHKIPWYQPGNVGQFMEIFRALGLQ